MIKDTVNLHYETLGEKHLSDASYRKAGRKHCESVAVCTKLSLCKLHREQTKKQAALVAVVESAMKMLFLSHTNTTRT